MSAVKDQPRPWLWISFSPVIRARKELRQRCGMVAKGAQLAGRIPPQIAKRTSGSIDVKFCAKHQGKAGYMKLATRTLFFLAAATAVLVVTEMRFGRSVQAGTLVRNSTTEASDTSENKIARAMSAGPDHIAQSARIIDTDAGGN